MEYYSIEMGPGWWVMLFGWPAIFGALVAFLIAQASKSRATAFVGLLLTAPMFLYLSLTPRFQWTAPLAFALLCVLVWRFEDSSRWSKCLLALPAASILIWLAFAVITQ